MKTSIQILGAIALATSMSFGEGDDKEKRKPKTPPNPNSIIEKLDKDGNGSVSLDEFKAGPRAQKDPEKAAEIFGVIDADKNGEVTKDEFAKHMNDRKGKGGGNIIEHLDKDGNGSVSLAEFNDSPRAKENPEMAAKAFAKMDADSNGEITKDEFAKHRGGPHPDRKDRKKDDGANLE